MSKVPTESEIVATAKPLLSYDSTLSLSKLLVTLQLENDWSLGEKRLKNVLISSQLFSPPPPPPSSSSAPDGNQVSKKKKKKKPTKQYVPKSYIDNHVTIPKGLKAVYFDSIKGKGLVSDKSWNEGDVLFTEEAWITTPPPQAVAKVRNGELCGHCFLPNSLGTLRSFSKNCGVKFCSLTCLTGSIHSPFLCRIANPQCTDLWSIIETNQWQSLHSVANSICKLLSSLLPTTTKTTTTTSAAITFEQTFSQYASFATVPELERRARNPGWDLEQSSFEKNLNQAWIALRKALDPLDDQRCLLRDQGLANSTLKNDPLSNAIRFKETIQDHPNRQKMLSDLFDYKNFLKLIGRSNINMESHGGLYQVHSFLNHDCNPNIQIRHVPIRGRLASMSITAIATRFINPNEELTISYIDPKMNVTRRRLVLWRDYCFGPCHCNLCVLQLSSVPLDEQNFDLQIQKSKSATKTNKKVDDDNLVGLEDELRTSLGF